MRPLATARTLLMTALLGGCAQVPGPNALRYHPTPAPESALGRCEIAFAHSADPLQRALLAARRRALREPRERATTWPTEPLDALGSLLPTGASALHRRPQGGSDPTAAYRERGRLQALAGDSLTARANRLLAREHALARGQQVPADPRPPRVTATAVATPLR